MKKVLLKQGFVALLLMSVFSLHAFAAQYTLEQETKTISSVYEIVRETHYKSHDLLMGPGNEEAFSLRWLNRYLDLLDYKHTVFTESQVHDFQELYGKRLIDQAVIGLMPGEPFVAEVIFKAYIEGLVQVQNYEKEILNQKFNFDEKESFVPRTTKSDWPKNAAEQKEIWRKFLKSQLLSAKLKGENLSDAKAKILKSSSKLISKKQKMLTEDNSKILELYLNAFTSSLDPHTDYFLPQEAKDFTRQTMNQDLQGIGASLTQDEDGNTTIHSIVPGSPAEKCRQLSSGDQILSVAQENQAPVSAKDMPLEDLVGLIRGEKGTTVILTVLPSGSHDESKVKTVKLVRDTIKEEETHAKGLLIEHPVGLFKSIKIGFVKLPLFYQGASSDILQIIENLKQQNIEGLILDLRDNPGGLLTEAELLAGLFLGQSPVTQTKNTSGQIEVLPSQIEKAAYTGPLVVMTNIYSASASEITAAALQDTGRALVVGDWKTHGKGTVQNIFGLSPITEAFIKAYNQQFSTPLKATLPVGSVKTTIMKFYRINGGTTQRLGVVPDFILPSLAQNIEEGEAGLENNLESDFIQPAEYKRQTELDPYKAKLIKLSQHRVSRNPEFKWIQSENTHYLALKNQPYTLNEKEKKQQENDEKNYGEQRKSRLKLELRHSRDSVLVFKNSGEFDKIDKNAEEYLFDVKPDDLKLNTDSSAALLDGVLQEQAKLEEAENILADVIPLLKN